VRILFLAFSLCTAAVAQDGAAALDKLRALVGEWDGTVEWSGARTDTGAMHVSYSTSGYGSAVVENLGGKPGAPAMTSVYHLDGNDLRVTHFCGSQNQPRLKASRIDTAKGEMDFAFVDITNLKSPDAPHVYGLELRLVTADHIIVTFLFEAAGKQSRERIDLKRVTK